MRRSLVAVACVGVLAGGAERAQAAAYTITPIDLPPVEGTIIPPTTTLSAINDSGQIVGYQTEYVGSRPGRTDVFSFVYNAGAYSLIRDTSRQFRSNSDATLVLGINDAGQVVGSTSDFPVNATFVYSNNKFDYGLSSRLSSLGYIFDAAFARVPPAQFMIIGINDSGVVLSNFKGGLLNYNNGVFTSLATLDANPLLGSGSLPPNVTSISLDINNALQIVGSYTINYGVIYSTLDTAGVITPIVVPGSRAGSTKANGISNSGVIAGSYLDIAGAGHGFLDDNGAYTTVDVPGALYTSLIGVNNAGDIIGTYGFSFSGSPQNFLGTPVAVPEPASAALLGMGVAALGLVTRQRRMPMRSART